MGRFQKLLPPFGLQAFTSVKGSDFTGEPDRACLVGIYNDGPDPNNRYKLVNLDFDSFGIGNNALVVSGYYGLPPNVGTAIVNAMSMELMPVMRSDGDYFANLYKAVSEELDKTRTLLLQYPETFKKKEELYDLMLSFSPVCMI